MPTVQPSEAKQLAETCVLVKHEMFREWSVDELLCHPLDAIAFCDEVRTLAGTRLSDFVILASLLSARKRAMMSLKRWRESGIREKRKRLAELLAKQGWLVPSKPLPRRRS